MASFQVENVLAAAAAAWRLGVPLELVRVGLESFACGAAGSPGRFNLLEKNGATVVVDYGHNLGALEQMCRVVEQLPGGRRIAVYSAAGDRRDEDLLAQGRVLGAMFDRVVFYEDAYVRGRQPGDITRVLSQGIAEIPSARAREVVAGGPWLEAATQAIESLVAGDVLLLQADSIEQTMAWLASQQATQLRETSVREILGPGAAPEQPPAGRREESLQPGAAVKGSTHA